MIHHDQADDRREHYYERLEIPGDNSLEIQVMTYTDCTCVSLVDYEDGVVLFHLDYYHQAEASP
jgi:hypothetical protein